MIKKVEVRDDNERKEAYAKYQEARAENPAYTFFCYIDVDYVAVKGLSGISENTDSCPHIAEP